MKIITLFSILFFAATAAAAQQTRRCLSEPEVKKVIESMSSPIAAGENKKLRKALVEMRREREKLDSKIAYDFEKNQKLVPEANKLGETQLLRVCQLLRENGWLARQAVGDDAYDAFAFLLISNKAIDLQKELLPILSAAAKKGLIGNHLLANAVDTIRVGSGAPQIFGTQATIRNDVVYLYPLQNEEKVDEWRKMYGLAPLAAQIREFEDRYLLPVLKSQRTPQPTSANRKNTDENGLTTSLGIADENDDREVLKIDTKIVNLNVRVLAQDPAATSPEMNLTKDDFAVFEDGAPQEVLYFSSTEQPFDLILLLDFSGSTLEKRDLIKRAAQRFVETTRASDRTAVIAFTDEFKIISELTGDKAAVAQKIKDIEIEGGSSIWEALQYTFENVVKKSSAGRRSAIVFMTDGEDASPETTFADVMETVRRGETTIFPIYLDVRGFNESNRYLRKSRQTLVMLAEESGGQFYKADDLKDLTGVYEQVVRDLGKIYTLGYEPKNEARDGAWRSLTVKVKNRPNLIARSRRGYYAN